MMQKIEVMMCECSNPSCRYKWIPNGKWEGDDYKQETPEICPNCKVKSWNLKKK